MNGILRRTLVASAAALATVGIATSAFAEVVTYSFTATIDSADAAELGAAGIPSTGGISGSFSYDTEKGWWGGSNMWADPSLSLTIDQLPSATTTSTYLTVEYNNGTFELREDTYDGSYTQVGAKVFLSGQTAVAGTLPTSLSLNNGAGTISLFIGGAFGDVDLSATMTSLKPGGGAASTPELDPASGMAALTLLLGGIALTVSARRRQVAGAV